MRWKPCPPPLHPGVSPNGSEAVVSRAPCSTARCARSSSPYASVKSWFSRGQPRARCSRDVGNRTLVGIQRSMRSRAFWSGPSGREKAVRLNISAMKFCCTGSTGSHRTVPGSLPTPRALCATAETRADALSAPTKKGGPCEPPFPYFLKKRDAYLKWKPMVPITRWREVWSLYCEKTYCAPTKSGIFMTSLPSEYSTPPPT